MFATSLLIVLMTIVILLIDGWVTPPLGRGALYEMHRRPVRVRFSMRAILLAATVVALTLSVVEWLSQ